MVLLNAFSSFTLPPNVFVTSLAVGSPFKSKSIHLFNALVRECHASFVSCPFGVLSVGLHSTSTKIGKTNVFLFAGRDHTLLYNFWVRPTFPQMISSIKMKFSKIQVRSMPQCSEFHASFLVYMWHVAWLLTSKKSIDRNWLTLFEITCMCKTCTWERRIEVLHPKELQRKQIPNFSIMYQPS